MLIQTHKMLENTHFKNQGTWKAFKIGTQNPPQGNIEAYDRSKVRQGVKVGRPGLTNVKFGYQKQYMFLSLNEHGRRQRAQPIDKIPILSL